MNTGDFGISQTVYDAGERILKGLKERFETIDRVAETNQWKVIAAMQGAHVSEAHLTGTTGYGYSDIGRETLEQVYANVFHTEDALVRPQLISGTHALHVALSGNLRPGDILLSVSGRPYDTLEEVIGIRPSNGSLADYGVSYREVPLTEEGRMDLDGIRHALTEGDPGKKIRLAAIQRSRGYQTRPSFSVSEIGEAIRVIKDVRKDVIVMVDNCYGEFTELTEPTDAGADMAVGSLIKNPGGGLAPTGGYIAGTKACVENAAIRLSAPGLGKEVGASLEVLRTLYQGLFLSPTVTAAAVKGAIFASAMYEAAGYECFPKANEERYDIIQAITLRTPEALRAFCEGIQEAAPVDSFVRPEASDMPGYESRVIMAAGAFISGASIELSADGPMRPPFNVYFQGGLTFAHAKLGILKTVQKLSDIGLISLDGLS